MNANTKRDRLIDAAADLFHKKGLLSTSLADIAKHADIPIGNVYYYFKAKDELALAALEKRMAAMDEVYEHLDSAYADPRERLLQIVQFFDKMKEDYGRFGCPIYRMITDGSENDKMPVAETARTIYEHFTAWADKQFRALGYGDEAFGHAIALLAGIQGGAVMARAYDNAAILEAELTRLQRWLENLPNRKIFLGKSFPKSGTAA